MPVSFSPRVGDRIADRFELGPLLRGQGTVRVFSARDHHTDRAVAIVLVDPARVRANAWGAFAGVVNTLVRTRVAGLVLPQVSSAIPNPPYCIEELQPLCGFDSWRDKGPLPWQRALALGERAAAILGEAHAAAGVAHRALTPSRCATTPSDDVRVLDFGVAELKDDYLDDSGYRAPEQQHGRSDARSDVYTLGLILFELITGRSWAGTAPPSLRSLVNVPRPVDEFFARVLARDPAQRPADVATMRAAMRALLESAAEPARPAPASRPPASVPGVTPTGRKIASTADRTEIVPAAAPTPPLADRTEIVVPATPTALRPADRTEIVVPATPAALKLADRTEIVPAAAPAAPPDRTEIVPAAAPAAPPLADRTEILAAVAPAAPPADRTEILAAAAPAATPADRTEIVRPAPAGATRPRPQPANALLRPAAAPADPLTEQVPASPLVPSDTTMLLPASGPTAAPPQPVREPTPPDPMKKALIWINVVCFTAILLVLCVRLLS